MKAEEQLVGFFCDRTERSGAEEERRATECLARSLVDAFSAPVAILDESGTIIAVNRAWRDFIEANHAAANLSEGAHYPEACELAFGLGAADAAAIAAGISAVRQGEQQEFAHEYPCRSLSENRWFSARFSRFTSWGAIFIVAVHENITERKRAEETRVYAEQVWQRTFDAIPDLIALIDTNHRITRVNRVMAERLGCTPEQVVGSLCYEGVHGLTAPPDFCPHSKLLISGREERAEVIEPRLGGVFDVSAIPLRDEAGRLLGCVHVARDITMSKQAAAALHASEAKYHALFQASADGILVADLETRLFRYANPAACRLFGYSEAELTKMGVVDMHPKDDLPWVVAQFEAQGRGEKSLVMDIPFIRKDGSIVLTDVNAVGMSIDGRKCNAGFIRDITERKRAEQLLREAEEQFHSLFAATPLPTFLWDLETLQYLEVNDAAVTHSGYSREELLGMRVTDLLPPEAATGVLAQMKVLGAQSRDRGHGRHRLKDGRVVDVEANLSALNFRGRRAVLGVIQDITERKRAEEKLKLTLVELERSNKELEQFAYVASHDLQEPLRMVSSYTQLLAKRYQGRLDADADEFIAFAVDGANRMQRLINDLLTYSRVGTRGKEPELTDYTAVLDQALVNLKVSIAENSATVTHDQLPIIMADKLQMVQLFQNLIANAIKFHGKEAPHVHISAKQSSNDWVFSVRDNGIGIDPQYAERIFIIFQRLHTKEDYPGTGIGLAVCKKIVERHGGRIWVESQPGTGAAFNFTIPIRR